MNIMNTIQNKPQTIQTQTKTNVENKTTSQDNQTTIQKSQNKYDVIDLLSKKVINKRDIEDQVTMPRSIFKGYLCFTAGTTLNVIANTLKNEKAKCILGIIGNAAAIVGTFNFVKPFLYRGEEKNT